MAFHCLYLELVLIFKCQQKVLANANTFCNVIHVGACTCSQTTIGCNSEFLVQKTSWTFNAFRDWQQWIRSCDSHICQAPPSEIWFVNLHDEKYSTSILAWNEDLQPLPTLKDRVPCRVSFADESLDGFVATYNLSTTDININCKFNYIVKFNTREEN